MFRLERLNVLNYKGLRHLDALNAYYQMSSDYYYYDESEFGVNKIDYEAHKYLGVKLTDLSKSEYQNSFLVYCNDKVVAYVIYHNTMFKSVSIALLHKSIKESNLAVFLLHKLPDCVYESDSYNVPGLIPVNLESSIKEDKCYKSSYNSFYYVLDKSKVNIVRDGIERHYRPKLEVENLKFELIKGENKGYKLDNFNYWNGSFSSDINIGFRYYQKYELQDNMCVFAMKMGDIEIGVIKYNIYEDHIGVGYIDISQFYAKHVIDLENIIIKAWGKYLKKYKIKQLIVLADDNKEEKERHLTERVKKILCDFEVLSYEERLYKSCH